MYTPKLDRRDRQDLLEQLRTLAASYVPEWRWDDREPDVGVILAHLYAAMMENTISRYNRSMYNHYLPSSTFWAPACCPPPAEGMISMGVTPGSGAYVDRGTAVYAAADTDSGRVFYETTEAVLALDTELESIFFTSAARDTIVRAYARGTEEPVRLFGFDDYPQLQRHPHLPGRRGVLYRGRTPHMRLLHAARRSRPRCCGRPSPTRRWRPGSTTMGAVAGDGPRGPPGRHPPGGGRGSRPWRRRRAPWASPLPPQKNSGGRHLPDGRELDGGGGRPAADALSSDTVELKEENFSPFGDALSLRRLQYLQPRGLLQGRRADRH